jgi:hypothetical protein
MESLSSNVKSIQDSRAKRSQLSNTTIGLVSLNFKVPLRVRQQFKIYAAQHNMTMTELLLQLLDDRLNAAAPNGGAETFIKQEIKK